ncbi:MAG: hypothetical protein NTX73_05015 [Rhodobacterales bacterium]|nr:hypothetical protein [Rhodobacterales bacterium]
MQERYLGDSHDYLKYSLLGALSGAGLGPVALAWYLTFPELVDRSSNKDGEKRHHINGKGWDSLDPVLLQKLNSYQHPQDRSIGAFETSGILSHDTIFTARNPPVNLQNRRIWWQKVLADCQPATTVFSDPDNGFEVPSASVRAMPKYALYEEARSIASIGKIAVNIQFARQCDPVQRANEVRSRLHDGPEQFAKLPVLRGRVAPNILFVFLAPAKFHDVIRSVVENLVAKSAGRFEVIK